MNELTTEARTENLEILMNFVDTGLEKADCSVKMRTQISIAVEEIFVNIANYAYSPEIGSVTIRLTAGDEIIISFEDNGKPYNPFEGTGPDITTDVQEREVGGLGIFMVRSIMDSVEYRRVGDKNVFVMKKRLV
ncbi:MAG: ATP-binding protein [Oscillospiraceae bacterium]|nr:ATP-binding protein [Oscillospiraceae bacterium]